MFQTKVVEKIKTHILQYFHMYNSIFYPEYRTFYEITWKNLVEPGKPQMKIRHMLIAC